MKHWSQSPRMLCHFILMTRLVSSIEVEDFTAHNPGQTDKKKLSDINRLTSFVPKETKAVRSNWRI